jgi:hypothetical protein
VPQALFVAEVVARGIPHVARDSFRGESPPSRLCELATPVLIRADPEADEVDAFVRLGADVLALVDSGHGHVRIAADARAVTGQALSRL